MAKKNTKRTILILDDTKPIRILLLKKLEKEYRCLLSGDPFEGLDLFQEYMGEIDLVLLDYEMPGMNGEEFLDAIQAMQPDIAVIIVSASLNEKRIQQLLKKGVRSFVAKPVNINRLTADIKAVLNDMHESEE